MEFPKNKNKRKVNCSGKVSSKFSITNLQGY